MVKIEVIIAISIEENVFFIPLNTEDITDILPRITLVTTYIIDKTILDTKIGGL